MRDELMVAENTLGRKQEWWRSEKVDWQVKSGVCNYIRWACTKDRFPSTVNMQASSSIVAGQLLQHCIRCKLVRSIWWPEETMLHVQLCVCFLKYTLYYKTSYEIHLVSSPVYISLYLLSLWSFTCGLSCLWFLFCFHFCRLFIYCQRLCWDITD